MLPHGNTARPSHKRLAIVARVSTEDQEEYGTSLDDQIAKGRLLAQLHDYTVDDRPYDEGGHIYSGDESGTIPLDHRKIMRRLIADGKARKFDAVCFYKIDRMARRLKYILEVWDALEATGCAVLIVDPPLDTSTPVGRLIRNVLGSIAEFERDTILERTMAGRRRKLARGENFLPTGKYGYRYTRIDHETHTPGRVTKDDDEAVVIIRMFERRTRAVSYERIAVELTADRIASPGGKPVWTERAVRRIIQDPAYKGEGLWGHHEAVRTAKGTQVKRKRADGHRPIAVAYPPIVSPALWQAAQEIGACGERHPVRAGVDKYLLRGGMVRCAEHGLVMTGSGVTIGYPRYRCVQLLPNGRRTAHQVPGPSLEEAVWSRLASEIVKGELAMKRAEAMAAEAEQELEDIARQRIAIERRLAALDGEADYLLRLGRTTNIAPERIERSMSELAAQEQELRGELAVLDAQAALVREDIPKPGEVARVLAQFREAVADPTTPEQKREILEAFGVQVTVRGMDFTIDGLLPQMSGSLVMHSGHPSRRPPASGPC